MFLSVKKAWAVLIISIAAGLFVVIGLSNPHQPHALALILTVFTVDLLVLSFLLYKNSRKKDYQNYEIEKLRERLNILNFEYAQERKNNSALLAKTTRYNNLKRIIEELNQDLKIESVSGVLADTAFSLIAANKGFCLVFLVDELAQRLNLIKTKKEFPELAVKAKEGDIFDYWVLRHLNPLIIRDIKNDFRFDLDRIKAQDIRLFSSLISSPLVTNDSVVGLLRLDNQKPDYFSQDDLRFLSLLADLGAVAMENSQLLGRTRDLAIHDDLTGLHTKAYFIERLREESKRCNRLNLKFSLLMIDIDFFKQYNDKFGHTAGDIVLKRISVTMKDFFKNYKPLLSRFGGEEFLVLLPGLSGKEAYSLADNLRKKIENEKIVLRRLDTFISVSIGLASMPADTEDEDELIQMADNAMYQAKQKGRNLVCCN